MSKNDSRKILLSGVKPSGRPHLGNYFGAMKQFVNLQEEYKSFIFVADLHALTTVQNKSQLEEYTLDVAIDYLAIGLDPKKIILYKQSDIPQVAELAWIFNCITTMPYLMRAHAFKDAQAKNKEINAGIFDYPMLMAADILLPSADVVPVGEDQKQHVEIARDTAQKFNRIFGETFKIPEALIMPGVEIIYGTDGQKMSKSHGNTIELFAEDGALEKAVMGIITDSKGVHDPKESGKCNVFRFHKLFTPKDELADIEKRYAEGKIGYKESKEILLNNMKKFIAPIRERRKEIQKNRNYAVGIMKEGGEKAREIIEKKMKEVRKKVGLEIR